MPDEMTTAEQRRELLELADNLANGNVLLELSPHWRRRIFSGFIALAHQVDAALARIDELETLDTKSHQLCCDLAARLGQSRGKADIAESQVSGALAKVEGMEHELRCNYIAPNDGPISVEDFLRELRATGPTDVCNCIVSELKGILNGK